MFGQNNQQQSSGGIFGAAPQLGQSTGGFSFGAGLSSGATSSAPSSGGFSFSAPGKEVNAEFLLLSSWNIEQCILI